jgi:hypothetical protein
VSSAISRMISGTVTFKIGSTTLGTAPVSGGIATLSNLAVSPANGFSVGSDSVTASYKADTNFSSSTGSTTLIVTPPTYTLIASQTLVTGTSNVTLIVTSTTYAGTVSFTTSITSANSTASDICASAPSITVTNGGNQTSVLTITSNAKARSHVPATPWQSSGAVALGAILLGTPLMGYRKRMLAVLSMAAAISLCGFLIACGAGSSATVKPARIYSVTAIPTGSGTVTNPSPVTITVTMQ